MKQTVGKRTIGAAILLLALAGLTLYYIFCYAFAFPVNSDNMYFLRAAEDTLRGNWLLKNWSGGYFTALTTDILWAAALRILFSRKIVLYLIGPLCYALIVLVSGALIFRKMQRESWLQSAFFLLPIVFVPVALRHAMLTVGMHNIAILTMLTLFLLLQKMSADPERRQPVWLTLYFMLLFSGCLSDGYLLYYFATPAALLFGFRSLHERSRRWLPLLLATILAAVGGTLGVRLLAANGYLQTQAAATQLTPLNEIGKYFLNLVDTWFRLFGFNAAAFSFSDNRVLFEVFGALAALLVALILLSALLRFFQQEIVSQLMMLSFLFVIGSFTFTTVTRAEPAFRYLSLAFYLGMILAARQLASLSKEAPDRKKYRAIFPLILIPLLLFSLGNLSIQFRPSPANDTGLIELAGSLKERGVHSIYGTYWETHALNYYADDAVQAAPIQAEAGALQPYCWSSKTDWYSAANEVHAVVVSKNKCYGITEALLSATFGTADEKLSLKDVDVYFYDQNLAGLIDIPE